MAAPSKIRSAPKNPPKGFFRHRCERRRIELHCLACQHRQRCGGSVVHRAIHLPAKSLSYASADIGIDRTSPVPSLPPIRPWSCLQLHRLACQHRRKDLHRLACQYRQRCGGSVVHLQSTYQRSLCPTPPPTSVSTGPRRCPRSRRYRRRRPLHFRL